MVENYFGEVRDIKDPNKAGRVKIRIYMHQNDEQKIKDDDLPWVLPLQPITSAGTGKVGVIPHGLVKGSRVLVTYASTDTAKQYPIILGSFSRSALPTIGGSGLSKQDTGDSKDKHKPNSEGIDNPATGNSNKDHKKNPHNPAIGGKPFDKDPKYADGTAVTTENGSGPEEIKTSRSQNVPKADMPTTASAPPGKDIAAAVAAVDPSGKAQAFPQLIKQFASITSIMALAAALGSSGDGGGSAAPSLTDDQNEIMNEILTEAYCILSNRYSFFDVIVVMNDALGLNNGLKRINSRYKYVILNSLANLIQYAIFFGEDKIPMKEIPKIVYTETPPPLQYTLGSLNAVPNISVQVYYTQDTDPYPGYIEFNTPENVLLYVKRTKNEPPFPTAEEECKYLSTIGLVTELDPYVKDTQSDNRLTLSVEVFNEMLDRYLKLYEDNGMERTIGKGSSTDIMSMLSTILGIVGTAVNTMKSVQLPRSVLDQGKSNKALEDFSKNMAMIKQMTSMAQTAMGGGLGGALGSLGGGFGGALGGIGGLGQLTSVAGSLSSGGLSLSSISSALGGVGQLGGLTGSLGTIGALTAVLSSNPSIINSINNSGSNYSQIISNATSVETVSKKNILDALEKSGATRETLAAVSILLLILGIN